LHSFVELCGTFLFLLRTGFLKTMIRTIERLRAKKIVNLFTLSDLQK
jgi:hypothetical protein